MTDELKRCPFCGSEDVALDELAFRYSQYVVRCRNCNSMGRYIIIMDFGHTDEYKKQAIAAWNRRANND